MDGTLRCARCEYDLRMLDVSGLCPECALPIRESIIAAAQPLPLARTTLRRAAIALLIAAGLRLVLAALIAASEIAGGRPRNLSSVPRDLFTPWPIRLAAMCIDELASRATVGGTWWLILVTLFLTSFGFEILGTVLLILRPVPGGRGRLLRAVTASIVGASLTLFTLLLVYRPAQQWLPSVVTETVGIVLPPVAVARWTGYLVRRARGRDWCRRYACPVAVVAAAVCGTLAAWTRPNDIADWAYNVAAVVSFVSLLAMWSELFRLTSRPPAATAPPASDTIA